ncbi:MAG: hypothetical protein J6Y88_01685 [Bacteroidales bacterium]|nr:hypothetical protein [Bacteroidales bacterium]
MANKGITKKQFRLQLIIYCVYVLLSVSWIGMGVDDGSKLMIILGSLYGAFVIGAIIALIIQRKRNPVENPELDKQMAQGMKGGGIMLGILTIGFLIAFGLAAILK